MDEKGEKPAGEVVHIGFYRRQAAKDRLKRAEDRLDAQAAADEAKGLRNMAQAANDAFKDALDFYRGHVGALRQDINAARDMRLNRDPICWETEDEHGGRYMTYGPSFVGRYLEGQASSGSTKARLNAFATWIAEAYKDGSVALVDTGDMPDEQPPAPRKRLRVVRPGDPPERPRSEKPKLRVVYLAYKG